MQQLKLLVVISLIVSSLADDMKKHQSNDTEVHKPNSAATEGSKMMKDTEPQDAKMTKTSMDHKMMDPKMMDAKMMDAKMMDAKMMDAKMMDAKMMDAKIESKTMDPKTPKDADSKSVVGADGKDSSGPAMVKEEQQTSKEDMKVEASVGLGFYAGVLPVGYGGYGGYGGYRGYGGYGYGGYRPSYPYYRSYYARPYYGYSYRPVVPVPVIVKPRPIPVLLG